MTDEQPTMKGATTQLATVGEFKTMVRMASDGRTVRSVTHDVTLSFEAGHLYTMKDWNTKPVTEKVALTALGYGHLAKYAGVRFARPPRVFDDDMVERQNPYVCRDRGAVRWARARCVGWMRGPDGLIHAEDVTITYDLDAYFMVKLMREWKKNKSGPPKAWGRLVAQPDDLKPTEKAYEVPGHAWLVVDLLDPDVMEIVRGHVERYQFADRYVRTLAARNVAMAFLSRRYVAPLQGSDPPMYVVRVTNWLDAEDDAGPVSFDGDGNLIIDGEAKVETKTEFADEDALDDVDESERELGAGEGTIEGKPMPVQPAPEPEPQPDEPAPVGDPPDDHQAQPAPVQPIDGADATALEAGRRMTVAKARNVAGLARRVNREDEFSGFLGSEGFESVEEINTIDDVDQLRGLIRKLDTLGRTFKESNNAH